MEPQGLFTFLVIYVIDSHHMLPHTLAGQTAYLSTAVATSSGTTRTGTYLGDFIFPPTASLMSNFMRLSF